MEKKSTPEARHRRKQLRAQRLADIAEQDEGVAYGAGLFWLFWNRVKWPNRYALISIFFKSLQFPL